MNLQIETFAATASALIGGVAGSKFGHLIANAAPAMPGWMSWALGPFGALVGVILALVWLAKRLDASEMREETRRLEREADRKATQEIMIALIKDTNAITGSAVHVMREVKEALEGCHRVKSQQ